MNGKQKEGESNRDFGRKPNGDGLPSYEEFYRRGITDSKGGWSNFLSTLCQFLKDRSNSTVIVIAAIIVLGYVAAVFIKSGSANYVRLTGGLTLGAMIFTLGLLALLNSIRCKSGADIEKKQRGSIESGPGQRGQEADGDIEGPDERRESD